MNGLFQKLRTVLAIRKSPGQIIADGKGTRLQPRFNQPLVGSDSAGIADNKSKSWLLSILLSSLGVTTFIWGVRELKWLQSWELKAYDQMLLSRQEEKPDERIVLVTIDEGDKWPLSDETVNKLLVKLESYQPRVIGLDIYRPEQKNLAAGVKDKKNIIAICLMDSLGKKDILQPPNFDEEYVGFSNVIPDDQDNQILRRALLFATPAKGKCTTKYSFASVLAWNYFKKQNIEFNLKDTNNYKLGKTIFPALSPNSGSYKGIDTGGYQILLNYRNTRNIAQTFTFVEVLNGQVDSKLIKDRLVIIGTTASTIPPGGFYTPYSSASDQPSKMPAVFVHAHIASQIISAVLDGRPIIWYWSDWGEYLWVWGWAMVGSVLALRLRHPLVLVVVSGVTLSGLVGLCFFIFLKGGWVPVVPPALSLVITGLGVMVYTVYRTQQRTKYIFLEVEKQQEAIEQLNLLLKENSGIQDSHHHLSPITNAPTRLTGDLLLGGRYKIDKVLASGGFGCTYLAEDTQRPGNPICVVKQLMPARRDTKFLQVARRLFNTEAEILEVLGKHRQIPELLAYFEDNQEFYLVQEYIEGHTLNEELPPHSEVQKESFVIDMLKQILEVLAFVHEHRVIHRDIKPGNIIRSSVDNRLVLIDFGAVKMMQPPTSKETELVTVAIGTRGYAPPEQFAGHPRLSSDIYALGMIAIQAVTGVMPHQLQPNEETGTIMWRQWAEISEELAAILDKMVLYHFSDRYQSAAAVLQDLKLIQE
ncbi:MAG: CHASE2 domain-containing protein [Cyanomargarita calcarea GSE-NOS-MK-12-04C]|uniref:non-specific serine/threonine protein kinase n=1 Tax=Cyanomargarita calcarea GSE-NOS-MK-12-04C TaxID=2839659 RepID=A0A951UWH5_9CYAN|nr:CHASE2 domain-containing protein [Cyanomargarita calcarea GSE-NOS-MK-12-04C]